jgi:hypothetical protein
MVLITRTEGGFYPHHPRQARLLGDYHGALGSLEESLALIRSLGSRGNEGWALNLYAAVLTAAGDLSRAQAIYQDALHLNREMRQPDAEASRPPPWGGPMRS